MRKVLKYLEIAKITLSSHLVYFWDYISKNLFFILIMFVYFMLWRNLFASKGQVIAGLTINGMMWYLVVTELITLSRTDVHLQVTKDVKEGSIAYLLNKPYHYIGYHFSYFTGSVSVKLLTNGLTGLALGFLFVGPLIGFDWVRLPLILFSILLGCILNFAIYMTIGLSAFWLEENQAFYWIYSKLVFTLGGMLMPLEMFPLWLQKSALYMPFAYVTYVPARLAVDFSMKSYVSKVGLQVVYVIFFFALATYLYEKGVKKLNVNGG